MGVWCVQPASVGQMGRGQRCLVFVVGMLEIMLWSGTIFGWASLVHLLKVQGVYSHLCSFSDDYNFTYSPNGTHPAVQDLIARGCVEQDEQYVQMYAVTCVVYATPGILIGYTLHHLGLAFTRVVAGLMISGGFILLSLTTQASPDYLWGAILLLAVGGNTIRTAGLQFGNLFPKHRGTAMAVLSGIFTPSAGLFVAQQYMYEGGFGWNYCCWSFAAASSLILLVTPFIPRHHIPYVDGSANQEEGEEAQEESSGGPIFQSIFSVSYVVGSYWLFINLFSVVLFATYFNSWINKFSDTKEEADHFSRLFGFANILCAFMSPLPGLMVDAIFSRLKRGKTGIKVKVAMVQAMIIPMVIVSLTVITQITSLFFHSPAAVYLGLVCLVINRPSSLAVANPFVRARFPANHFNRLIGIQGTVISFLTMLQYPHFTWAQMHYSLTMGVTVGVVLLGLAHPLHLLNRTYLTRVLQPHVQITKV